MSPTCVLAQPGADTLRIYEILPEEAPDLHDASLEDWKRLVPGPTLTEADSLHLTDRGPDYPIAPSIWFDLYLAWIGQPQRIYAGWEVRDDVWLLYQSEEMPYTHGRDRVILLVDGNGGGDGYLGGGRDWENCEERVLDPSFQGGWWCASDDGPAQAWEWSPYGEREPRLSVLLPEPRDWMAEPAWSEAGGCVGPQGNSLVMQGWVTPLDRCYAPGPEGSVISHLSAGQAIRYLVNGNDYDGPAVDTEGHEQEAYFHLNMGGTAYRRPKSFNPKTWAVALLMPASARPTGVAAQSWGQVKRGTRAKP
ncbi:MAG: hypothetical protein AB1505_27035 [Candidatus Latescibacterota bacterium]